MSAALSAAGRWKEEATAHAMPFSRLAADRRMGLEMSVPAIRGDFPAAARVWKMPEV